MAPESWLPFFERLELTWVGSSVRESLWAFPVIEAFHVLGLGMIGGAVLVVDMRLLGIGMTGQPITRLIRQVRPWLIAAVAMMLATGIPLFLSEAVKCYYNTSFWVKMISLPFAVAFTFQIRRRIVKAGIEEVSGRTRLIGIVSLTLWFVVAAAGRWIGFSG